jgi:hypothetical protein
MRHSFSLATFLLTALPTLAACAGDTLDVGTSKTQPVATSPTSDLPASLLSRCNAPHGSPDVPKTAREFQQRLTGWWVRCDGATGSLWATVGQGISLSPTTAFGGDYFALEVHGDASGAVQGSKLGGLDSEGAYSIQVATASSADPSDDTTPFGQIWVVGPNNSAPTTLEFESSPRRMRATPLHLPVDGPPPADVDSVWFVPFDDGQ